jgi:hypothetical protein
MTIRFARIALLTLFVTAAAISASTSASAQAIGDTDAEHGSWFGYRDLYQAMIRFDKYGKPKQFIQSRLQVVALDKSASIDGIRLTLTSKSLHVNLPVDAAGLVVFPLLKAAYDENAEMQVNRPNESVRLEPVTTIIPRADGIYDMGDLHTACEQALQFAHYINNANARGKQCAGIRFAFSRDASDVVIKLRAADQRETRLTITEGSPFDNNTMARFKLASYRFADGADKAQIQTSTVPLTITAQFE